MSIAVFADIDGVFHPTTEVQDINVAGLAAAGNARMIRERGLFRWTGILEDELKAAEQRGSDEILLMVHSSWKFQNWVTQDLMRDLLGPLGHRLYGFTSSELGREDSILAFVERAGIEEFVILDDARDAFRSSSANLIVTNPLLGLSEPAVQARIRRWTDSLSRAHLCVPAP